MANIPDEQVAAQNRLQRIVTLDALRGLAVMGILAMNIILFALPEMAYFSPIASGPLSVADQISWTAGFILFDGKMRGLFSLLFGASMVLIAMRAQDQGQSPASVHYRRMAWLAFFGLMHFYLIWQGDILFLYALAGGIAFLFIAMESRQLIVLAIIIYVFGCAVMSAMMGSLFLLEYAASVPDPAPGTLRDYREFMDEMTRGYAQDLALYRSDYAAILLHRWRDEFWSPLSLTLMNILETLPLMLIGMALFKNGFLIGNSDTGLYRKYALLGLGLGASGYAVLAFIAALDGFGGIMMMNIAIAWSMPFRLVMTVGYAAALVIVIAWMANGGVLVSALLGRVTAAGRMAFTNYIATSIAMTFLFYGYGLGLFGHVSRSGLWLYVFGGCAVMLIWSKPWLDHFRYGPLEWLWRSLARGEIQAMRKPQR